MLPKITILIVNFNSASFIENALFCLSRLTKNPYRVIVMDNSSKKEDWKKLKRLPSDYPKLSVIKRETAERGSLAHGHALNELIRLVDTPYFSILDADAIWLKKNWDEILINELNDQVKIIGTQADNIAKPQDFPLMYACLIETETFKKLDINFAPKDLSRQEDTGFEMRAKYLAARFKGKVLLMRNTRNYKNGPFKDLVGVGEYYLNKDDALPFASHFGRGSSLGAAKYYKSWKKHIYRLPLIGSYILKHKGKTERKHWFKICRKLVLSEMSQ